jgi:ribosomal protein S12 methylthiotransferase accessory factor
VVASYRELSQRAEVLDPFELMLPSDSTYNPDLPIPWVRSVDLVSGMSVMVPLERVAGIGCRVTGLRFTSNGQAAGNTYEEAVCHALSELIERDTTASLRFRWMDARASVPPPPLVPIETLPAEATQIVARFTAAELTTHVLDVTTDLRVPVFVAVLVPASTELGPDGQIAGLCAGCGAHPDREVALLRALTEAAQTHAVIVQGAREDLDVATIARATPRSHKANELGLHSQRGRLALLANSHRRSFQEIATWPSTDVAADVRLLVERIVACGMRRVLIVDLGDRDLPLAVVRAIVPGLQDLQESSFTWRARRALWSE